MSLEINGLEELKNYLGEVPKLAEEELQEVIRKNTVRLKDQTTQNAVFGRFPVKYKNQKRTGFLRNSIQMKVSRLEGEVGALAPYGGYVEFGTRFMRAQPYLTPAFDEVSKQFKDDLKKLV